MYSSRLYKLGRVMRNPAFLHICERKTQISCAITANCASVFATDMDCTIFLIPKSEISSF